MLVHATLCDFGIQKAKIRELGTDIRNTFLRSTGGIFIAALEIESVKEFLLRERLQSSLNSDDAYSGLVSGSHAQRNEREVRGFVELVFGSDRRFKISLRFEHFRGLPD